MKVSTDYIARDETIDAIKAFAIFCVIFGHCIQYGSGCAFIEGSKYYENFIFRVIYSFHMPLFMLISGYLFGLSVKKRKWYECIFFKAKTLIIPIFIWGIFYVFITFVLSDYASTEVSGIRYCIQLYLKYVLTGLWFLWAVFYCSAVVAITRHFFKDNPIVYFLGFILSFFLPDLPGFGIYLYKSMYPFFVIGYFCLSNHRSIIHYLSHKWTFFWVLVLVYILLFIFYDRDSFIYTTGHTILRNGSISINQFIIDVYRICIGLTGSGIFIILFYIAYPYFSSRVKELLSFLGRNTLGLYIIQGFLVIALAKVTEEVSGFNALIALVECMIVLMTSILVIETIKKSKLLRRLMLGAKS